MSAQMAGGDAAGRLIAVMAPLTEYETWIVTAALVDDGISLWCHRPSVAAPRLTDLELTLTDDVGTTYRARGGGSGGEPPYPHESRQSDFAPRPPAHATTLRVSASAGGDLGPALAFALGPGPARRHAPQALAAAFGMQTNRPRFVTSCELAIDPDGRHPVSIFGLEAWTEETALWAIWNSERGARYVLLAGGCRHPLGGTLQITPPGVSAARIRLPFVVDDDAERLAVRIRLRGTPGRESTASLELRR